MTKLIYNAGDQYVIPSVYGGMTTGKSTFIANHVDDDIRFLDTDFIWPMLKGDKVWDVDADERKKRYQDEVVDLFHLIRTRPHLVPVSNMHSLLPRWAAGFVRLNEHVETLFRQREKEKGKINPERKKAHDATIAAMYANDWYGLQMIDLFSHKCEFFIVLDDTEFMADYLTVQKGKVILTPKAAELYKRMNSTKPKLKVLSVSNSRKVNQPIKLQIDTAQIKSILPEGTKNIAVPTKTVLFMINGMHYHCFNTEEEILK